MSNARGPSPNCFSVRRKSSADVQAAEQKKWPCSFPQCDYQSGKKYYIKIHERTHEVETNLRRPFPCSNANCEYTATTEIMLRQHVEVKHCGSERKKKYECGMCPSKFFTRGSLKIHIKQHVKEKHLECTQCTFKIHSRSNLTRHVKTVHENSVKYSCSLSGCNFSSARSESLKQHLQTHNPDPIVRNPFPCSFLNCSYRRRSTDALNRHVYVHTTIQTVPEISPARCAH